jgi:monovalent cation:proton antiporter
MKINNVILQTVTKSVAFIILTFSVFLFFAGHHNPGGGFIGGLMTASALVLFYLAYDMKTMNKVLPFDFKLLTACGLLIAVGTGLGSFFFQVPFLSHTFGHVVLPLIGDIELATAMLFDLGVYFTVVGVTMTIILSIGGDE